jgi:hypothetical protein
MDTTNNITIANGRKAKIIVIQEFQSLKHLSLEHSNETLTNDSLILDITLINKSDKNIEFNHPSMPLVGFTQPKKNEISATPIFQITGKEFLIPGEQISFRYSIPLNLIEVKQSILVFTQTIERNRGQMVSINLSDFKSKR